MLIVAHSFLFFFQIQDTKFVKFWLKFQEKESRLTLNFKKINLYVFYCFLQVILIGTGGFFPNWVRKSFIALSWQLLKAIHFKRSERKNKGGSMSIASFHSSHMQVSIVHMHIVPYYLHFKMHMHPAGMTPFNQPFSLE